MQSEKKLALLGLLAHSIIQLRELPTSVGSEVWQRLGSILLVSTLWVAQVAAPSHYRRHREAFVTAVKLCFFCFPLLRRPRGHVQRVLDRPARPGLLGLVLDLVRVTWGEGRACACAPCLTVARGCHTLWKLLHTQSAQLIRQGGGSSRLRGRGRT